MTGKPLYTVYVNAQKAKRYNHYFVMLQTLRYSSRNSSVSYVKVLLFNKSPFIKNVYVVTHDFIHG